MVLAEQTGDWVEGRCYFGFDLLNRCRLSLAADTGEETGSDDPLLARFA